MQYWAALAMIAVPSAAMAQTVPTSVEPLVPAQGTILDVSAEGRTTRVPDLATIRAGVVSQAPTAAAALADNAQRMARVIAALKRAGIAPRDIATANVALSPQYRYTEGQAPAITGYQANNTVSVRFRDVAKAGSVLDALVAEGANQIDGPNLSLDKPEAALDEARTDAVRRARARADLYAAAAGMKVARVISIAEAGQDDGGSPIRPQFMARAMKADAAPTEIAPGEKDVTVTLSVRFLLQ
ncbi:SIMPL domain-containing protein [Sphingomonas sp. RP10(2022)]|uniref:SIMPL domain-containing protein n=1 Tax=Sphingomonas liriopis TaxID=2949094 RepID=A0A9X2KPW0_9SPHN|nr:SIMPL domain-containing protein [Sphingomonas liriopis]MCP3734337.1 SIMPL domain-containing protein [Sphingomonas liriopis]